MKRSLSISAAALAAMVVLSATTGSASASTLAGERCSVAEERARAERGSSSDVVGELSRIEVQVLACAIGRQAGLDGDLFEALVWAESAFQPEVVSSAGAQGLAQLMPGTAAELGIDPDAVFEPVTNLRGGASYLAAMLDRFGSVERALAAYNAGPGRAHRAYADLPKETQLYVAKIMRRAGYRADDPDLVAVLDGEPDVFLAHAPTVSGQTWLGGMTSMHDKEAFDDNPS